MVLNATNIVGASSRFKDKKAAKYEKYKAYYKQNKSEVKQKTGLVVEEAHYWLTEDDFSSDNEVVIPRNVCLLVDDVYVSKYKEHMKKASRMSRARLGSLQPL